jgi:2-polyprenyl-3-methyl-5-hydroxy-6-metoxy-1,4-benzoquinol methylase
MGAQVGSSLGTEIVPDSVAEARRDYPRFWASYAWASGFVEGKRVLDAACGSGFGSAMLGERAVRVLGLELEEVLLGHARSHFGSDNVSFLRWDLHEKLLTEDRFDVLVSFQTLEHVEDPEKVLSALNGVLTEEATAVFGVPNGEHEMRDGKGKPYHVRQFTRKGLGELLGRHYHEVEFFSQVYRKGWGHYVSKLFTGRRRRAGRYGVAEGLQVGVKTWLAVCKRPKHISHRGTEDTENN